MEIGFGDGTETLALLADGWRVLAIDPTPAAAEVLRPRVPPSAASRLEIVTARVDAVELPPFDLLYAGYALPFIRPEAFPRVWADVVARVRPGGFLVVNLFGVHDTWASDPDMTFVDAARVQGLVAGLEVARARRGRERRGLVRRAEALARVRHRRTAGRWTGPR